MKLLLVVANVLLPVAVLIFATGFFPYKPFIPGLASHTDFKQDYGDPPVSQYDRLIFMVVDALRSDFVFSSASGFSFTQKLIRDGDAVPFTGIARPPTITMPRVKAITTGSIPSFLDVILNFAESDTTSTLADQDTWLAQIRAGRDGSGTGKLVMYGDDTWLKLFPDMFTRADGTSSFFVSDFTEVDQNVTRHVPKELVRDDWNAMIMHYLGLDHIGHKAGPTSPNMVLKHMEMDGIIRQIYSAISNLPHLENTLLILCGDHGMNDGGNHGGSAPGETETALLFVSPKLRTLSPSGRKCPVTPKNGAFEFYTTVEQSDLAPTITSLLGLPIPRNNLGVLIPDFLRLWKDSDDQLQLLLRNALQILSIVKAQFPGLDFENVQEDCQVGDHPLVCEWKIASKAIQGYRETGGSVSPALTRLYKFCKEAQDVMSGTASNYDVPRMIIGVTLSALSFITLCFDIYRSPRLFNVDSLIFITAVMCYAVMMFASSYVEEEQHFWYWISAGWIAYLHVQSLRKSNENRIKNTATLQLASIGILLSHRIIQRWNQTGQKYSGAPDIVTHHLLVQPIFLWTLVTFTYTILLFRITLTVSKVFNISYFIGIIPAALLTTTSLIFKIGFTSADAPELFYWLQGEEVEQLQQLPLISIARLTFTGLAILTLLILIKNFLSSPTTRKTNHKLLLQTLHSLLSLFLITQSRTANIPLFFLFHFQLLLISSLSLSPTQIAISSFFISHASFYSLGNSNAISSIDLSNAYNGVAGYNVLAVGILVFVSNWAGPIWWAGAAAALLAGTPGTKGGMEQQEEGNNKTKMLSDKASVQTGEVAANANSFVLYFSLATLFASGSLLAVQVACTALRSHLFIWTVFSPKYLYSMAWTLGYHFLINFGLVGAFWSLKG